MGGSRGCTTGARMVGEGSYGEGEGSYGRGLACGTGLEISFLGGSAGFPVFNDGDELTSEGGFRA